MTRAGREAKAGFVRCWLSELEWRAGEWPRAETLAREATERLGDVNPTAFPRALLAACTGRAEEASAIAEGVLAWSAANDERVAPPRFHWLLGLLELSRGDAERAHVSLATAHALLDAAGIREPGYLPLLPDLIESLVALDRLDEADEMLARLDALRRRARPPLGPPCRATLPRAAAPRPPRRRRGRRARGRSRQRIRRHRLPARPRPRPPRRRKCPTTTRPTPTGNPTAHRGHADLRPTRRATLAPTSRGRAAPRKSAATPRPRPAHRRRNPRRDPRRRRPKEQRSRGRAVHHRRDRRSAPDPHLPQARHPLPQRTRPPHRRRNPPPRPTVGVSRTRQPPPPP